MPGFVTHWLLGQKASLNVNLSKVSSFISKHPTVFALGCQGPDLLLFYHRLPLQSNGKEVTSLGSAMHDNHVNDFFENMLDMAIKEDDETMLAYIAGFVCHNALDSIAHPYVYYLTDSKYEKTYPAHQLLECQIDRGMLDLFKIDLHDIKYNNIIKLNKKEKASIAKLLHFAVNKTYEKTFSLKVFEDAYKDAYFIETVLNDPDGKKYPLFEKLEKIFNMPGLGTSMLIPIKYDEKMDAMNYRRDKWYDPCNENNSYTTSFEELFSNGMNKACNNLGVLNELLNQKIQLNDFLDVIGDISYTTGYPGKVETYYFKKDKELNRI